jgi:uncharacterized phage infection (PIP) family protein YhgE
MANMSQDEKINAIHQMVQEVVAEVKEVKSEVKELKSEVKELKIGQNQLQEGQNKINARLDVLVDESHENKADIRLLKKSK